MSDKSQQLNVARDFFSGELKNVMVRHRISAQENSFNYLVDLLVRFIESDTFFVRNREGKLDDNVLADLYAAYLSAPTEQKKLLLQRLGDVCLVITGFFSDSLKRKIVDVDYYFGMGGGAYHTLSSLFVHKDSQNLYQELAEKFKPFSNVIGEVSEKGGLQSNCDILRIYEKWVLTGSEHLRTLLSQQGIIAPIKVDTNQRH